MYTLIIHMGLSVKLLTKHSLVQWGEKTTLLSEKSIAECDVLMRRWEIGGVQ